MEVSKDTLNGTSRMFILGSYYCADNLSEWSFQLECLTAKLRKEHKCRNTEKSKVLLLGSPIYFPNYKVPFLIEEVGLELLLQADYTTLSMQDCRMEWMQKERKMGKEIPDAVKWFRLASYMVLVVMPFFLSSRY